MLSLDTPEILLISIGSAVMGMVVLRAIGQGAVGVASELIVDRREREATRKAENAAAEAAGRAAALEPLALNPDGTIEEPIIGVVEQI